MSASGALNHILLGDPIVGTEIMIMIQLTDPAKAQGRVLLQALCRFILPAIPTTLWHRKMDIEQISSGAEADELITELEKFISGIISRSQLCTKDITIEAALPTRPAYLPEADHFQQKNHYPMYRGIWGLEERVNGELQKLRKKIYQKMPIRLLCFEPDSSKLTISLLERNEIYQYLAPKVRANIYDGEPFNALVKYTKYAILSHTWTQTPGELTYGDWKDGSLDATQPKCQKLVKFCQVTWENHGFMLGWIDTVCINKESSAELDESIRSMYAWYSNAAVCITYLAGTNILSDMRNDPWFTRGWTLQELIAPEYVEFYNKAWNRLSDDRRQYSSDKSNPLIQQEIEFATTIDQYELVSIRYRSIARKMQLAAKRQVTREEDTAYCLMGIFDISISTAYGEGAERAFSRLVEEIFRSTRNVSDIFNWGGGRKYGSRQPITSLFPVHPSNYLHRVSDQQWRHWNLIEPLILTHLGLRTPILLMPSVPIRESVTDCQPIGDYHATISITPFQGADEFEVPKSYHLLDKRFSGPEGLHKATSRWHILKESIDLTLTIGTLNVEEHGNSIHIPKTCLAVLLQSTVESRYRGRVTKISSPGYDKVYTEEPIVFDLKKAGNDSDEYDDEAKHYYKLQKNELVKHGMELVTLYL